MITNRKLNRSQQGFTLLEILVAVLVLSFGLLGLAGLQAASIRSNHSAYLRTQATHLAYDMADRMRANSAGVEGGYYNNPTLATTPSCYTASGCTAMALARDDAARWNAELQALLPAGSAGVVCVDGTPLTGSPAAYDCDNAAGANYVVKVWWRDDPTNPSSFKQFVVNFRP